MKVNNADQSYGGLTFDLGGHYQLGLGQNIVMPLFLGLSLGKWSGATADNSVTVTINFQTINLGLGGYYLVTPNFHVGLNLEYHLGVGGSVDTEATILGTTVKSSTKAKSFNYLLYGPGIVYAITDNHRILADLLLGTGSFALEGENSTAANFTLTSFRVAYGYFF